MALVVGALIAFSADPPDGRKIAMAPDAKGQVGKNSINDTLASLPPITGEISNGNSAFTKKLVHMMELAHAQRYLQHFAHAMNQIAPDEEYLWIDSNTMFGRIRAGERFKSGSGVYCRPFKELTSYHGTNQRLSGVACQRRKGGWCRLRRSSAYTCEIAKPNDLEIFFKNLF
jgi:surface antigen